MERLSQVLSKLHQITELEWETTAKKCRKHIHLRIKPFQRRKGAHSERTLGMPVFEYYFGEAVGKLYTGAWDWKFEQYSLLDQLVRIIDSLISHAVEKYNTAKSRSLLIEYRESLAEIETTADVFEEKFENLAEDNQIKILEDLAESNLNWTQLIYYLKKGLKASQIAQEMDLNIKSVYKMTEKLYAKARQQFQASLQNDINGE